MICLNIVELFLLKLCDMHDLSFLIRMSKQFIMFAAHMEMWDASEIPVMHLAGVSIIMNQPLSGWFTCCMGCGNRS